MTNPWIVGAWLALGFILVRIGFMVARQRKRPPVVAGPTLETINVLLRAAWDEGWRAGADAATNPDMVPVANPYAISKRL